MIKAQELVKELSRGVFLLYLLVFYIPVFVLFFLNTLHIFFHF